MKKKIIVTALASIVSISASAETLTVVGSWSSLPLHNHYEKPYWSETVPNLSNGGIEVQLSTHNQMGLGLGDV